MKLSPERIQTTKATTTHRERFVFQTRPPNRSHGRQNPPGPFRAPQLATLQHRRRARPVHLPTPWPHRPASNANPRGRTTELRAAQSPSRSSAPTTQSPSPTPTATPRSFTRTSTSTSRGQNTGSASAPSPPTGCGAYSPWRACCLARSLRRRRKNLCRGSRSTRCEFVERRHGGMACGTSKELERVVDGVRVYDMCKALSGVCLLGSEARRVAH